MRLKRPHIPLSVRVRVIERQLLEVGITPFIFTNRLSLGRQLGYHLVDRFGYQKVELHHRPALINRQKYVRNGKILYRPDANDENYLVYLPADEHDIETRVRGQHGQHSDLALVRKRKRKERKATRRKTKWPSRPLRSASRWPKRKSKRYSTG